MKLVLDASCDPQGPSPGSRRYVTNVTPHDVQLILHVRYSGGSRSFETHIYEPGSYPFDLIGPTTVIWQPFATTTHSADEPSEDGASGGDESDVGTSKVAKKAPEPLSRPPKRKRKGKGKAKESTMEATPDTIRVVWLRSHPSIHDGVFSSLQTAVALTLEAEKRASTTLEINIEVELADLRGQINAFEITGPKASQVLKGALTPVPQDQREDFGKVSIFSPFVV